MVLMETCKAKKTKISIIVPTLNEEKNISNLLLSLKKQSFKDFETIIVDGGSSDNTVRKARKFGAITIVKPGLKEFPSRNEGVKIARGEILLFTGADVVMLEKTLETIINEFEKNEIDGLCAFGRIRDAPFWGKIEYYLHYSLLRSWIKISRDFHGSTNFMALRREEFNKTGGFKSRIDADGNLLNSFANNRKVEFLNGTKYFFVSGRRMKKMGFFSFNFHFLYMVDIFFPFLRESKLIGMLKKTSASYRASESKNKKSNIKHVVENI
jgi:glycosyltransferase involved in cell wall biosynthesis